MPYPPAAVQAVRDAVRAALAAETGGVRRWALAADVPASAFIAAAARHRVVEVLADSADVLDLPGEVHRWLATMRRTGRLQVMRLAGDVHRIHHALETAGVTHAFFKGPVLAAQTTGDFTARGSGDVDILVDPAQVAAAIEALRPHGWLVASGFPQPSPGFAWRRLMSSYDQVPLTGDSATVDLHWHLDPLRGVLPDLPDLTHTLVEVSVAGVEVPTLDLATAFRHACGHAAKDDWRWLRSLVDIHRLLHQLPAGWASAGLRDVDHASLAVTAAHVGLPAGQSAPPRRRPVVVAARTQMREVPQVAPRPFPGRRALQAMCGRTRGRRDPQDLARVVGLIALPPHVLADLGDRNAAIGLPRALARRAVDVARRVKRWPSDHG